MEIYQNDEIKVEGAISIRLLNQFYMKEQLNEHMSFCLGGYIALEDVAEYEKKRLLGETVRIYKEADGEETAIGCGIITEAEFQIKGGTCYVLIKGHSASYNMISEKRRRSFQNPDWTYRNVIAQVAGEQAEIYYHHDKEELLKSPIIQYEENDWELLRRIAGQLHTILISDVLSGKNRVFVGCRTGKVHNISQASGSQLFVRRCREGKVKISCTAESVINVSLGDTVILDNRRWIAAEKQTVYKDGTLETEYILGRLQDWSLPVTYNPYLCGAAIRGKVLKRKNESIKLWLEIDGGQKEEDAFWYPYLPETGNVMYTMPEEGAGATIYFPDSREQSGIVINSFLADSSQDDSRRPEIKGIDTPLGKEIKLMPDAIKISGGKSRKVNEICLGEETGIQLVSRKPVHIAADSGISIRSALSCAVTANSQISVMQTGEKNKIEMFGNQIVSQAEKYHTSSMIHKSKKSALERSSEPKNQFFHDLHGAYIGMIAKGDCGTVNEKILAGIPVMGTSNESNVMEQQEGLRVSRDGLF